MKNKILKTVLILSIGLNLIGCIPPTTKNKYTVVFMSDNEEIIKREVLHGKKAIAPDNPTKDGYNFIGWDQDFSKVTSDIIVNAIFEKAKDIVYEVIFYDDNDIEIIRLYIKDGNKVTPPQAPIKPGYNFIGWDKDLEVVNTNLEVRPLYEGKEIDLTRKQYTSYVSNLTYHQISSSKGLLNQIDYDNDLIHLIENIYNGGFRGADQMHYYDASNIISRNLYGYEVAIDDLGIVIQKGTLVDLPNGGFILSGHTSTSTFLQNKIQIGDVIRYHDSTRSASCYRNQMISSVIGLGIEIEVMIPKINQAFNNLLALNYQLILEKINQLIDIYNDLTFEYNLSKYNQAKELLINLDFLLVESKPVEVKAFWHYPLRAGTFSENNLYSVRGFLDCVAQMGFNRIYLNTNFGGYSIYQSTYLKQMLTTNNTYAGYKDYLECFITEAHNLGIEVFAWTNTLIGGDGYLSDYYRSRNWITKGFNNEDNFNGMYFLDISNPEVQTFLYNVYHELANNYALDGIEYDFIRFPNNNIHNVNGVITNTSTIKDSGYTPTFIDAFKAEYQFIGDFKEAIINSKDIRTNWLTYKTKVLNDTVKMLSTTIKQARPGIVVSAAVMPNITTARNVYLQDWDYWINQGWVDILEPMVYSSNNNYLITTLTSMKNFIGDRAGIVGGIFPEGSGGTSGMNAEQIALITQLDIEGFSKFSSKTIFSNQSLINSFGLMSRVYTVTPLSSNALLFNAFIYDALDKIDYYYQYIDPTSDYTSLLTMLKSIYNTIDFNRDYQNDLDNILTEILKINNQIIKTRLMNHLNQVKKYLN